MDVEVDLGASVIDEAGECLFLAYHVNGKKLAA